MRLLVREILKQRLNHAAWATGRRREEHDCRTMRLQKRVQRRRICAHVDRAGHSGAARIWSDRGHGGRGRERARGVGLRCDSLEQRGCEGRVGRGGGCCVEGVGRGHLGRGGGGSRRRAAEHGIDGRAKSCAERRREEIGR